MLSSGLEVLGKSAKQSITQLLGCAFFSVGSLVPFTSSGPQRRSGSVGVSLQGAPSPEAHPSPAQPVPSLRL